MAQQNPSSKEFVFRPNDSSANVTGDVEAVGKIEELKDEGLMLVETPESKSNPEQAWNNVRDKLQKVGSVQPVLFDELGEAHYPTGEITVRFHEAPTDTDLEEFADEHKLKLRKRNEFVSKQVVFDVDDAGERYLPKVVEKIAEGEKVKNAWANTLSRYKRISKS